MLDRSAEYSAIQAGGGEKKLSTNKPFGGGDRGPAKTWNKGKRKCLILIDYGQMMNQREVGNDDCLELVSSRGPVCSTSGFFAHLLRKPPGGCALSARGYIRSLRHPSTERGVGCDWAWRLYLPRRLVSRAGDDALQVPRRDPASKTPASRAAPGDGRRYKDTFLSNTHRVCTFCTTGSPRRPRPRLRRPGD